MRLAQYSIKNPVFLSCVLTLIMIIGYLFLNTLPVDYYPKVEIPTITVNTVYRGVPPTEIEAQVTKPLEDAISTVPGISYLRSFSQESVSTVVIEFDLEVDIKYSLNQVRDKIQLIRQDLPTEIEEPLVNIFDLSNVPLVTVNIRSEATEDKLYYIVNDIIKPQLTQVRNFGQIDISGIRPRQALIQLDREKLYRAGLSGIQVEQAILQGGRNIPLGQQDTLGEKTNLTYRTIANYTSLADLEKIPIFSGRNRAPVLLGQIATIKQGLENPSQLFYLNGEKTYTIDLFRQSGSNDIEVSNNIQKKVGELNIYLEKFGYNTQLHIIKDTSNVIRDNIEDVRIAIYLGVLLTIIVVYFFLGSARSTLITGLALPNSILGAFIIMAIAGFTINIMTLLSLSLAIGLLIDDAIVVRENIYRHRKKLGKSLAQSAVDGTKEVSTAVIATTLCIIAVFAPIAFVHGIVGQFLKEFGLTVCFALLISLFDALTMAPMLSATLPNWKSKVSNSQLNFYHKNKKRFFQKIERWQEKLEEAYTKTLRKVIAHPSYYLLGSTVIFLISLTTLYSIPITFIPPQDQGEIYVDLDLPPGTSLAQMNDFTFEIDSLLRKEPEIETVYTKVGTINGNSNLANIFVKLVSQEQRDQSTSEYKNRLRSLLDPYERGNPQIGDGTLVSGTSREYNLNLIGSNLDELEEYANKFVQKIRDRGVLVDVNTNLRPGKPEYQVIIDENAWDDYAISPNLIGSELRYYIQGKKVANVFLDNQTIPIHMQIKKEQAYLNQEFDNIQVPNINFQPTRLKDVSSSTLASGPSTIFRINRTRFVQVSAEVHPNGPGMNGALLETEKIINDELGLPTGMSYQYYGQAHLFNEMLRNMLFALGLGVLFIYLVLCSLYKSFITPLTVMLVLPLALSGALIGLWLFQESLNLFSIIACIMLLGLATKNSILLVNYANQEREKKKSYTTAILNAGRLRLRPILMTSIALITGILPIAIGLNEVANQRTSMGIVIIGGTITSTILSLLVIPAAYTYIDRFDKWTKAKFYANSMS